RCDIAAHAEKRRDHLAVVGDQCATPIRLCRKTRVLTGYAAQQAVSRNSRIGGRARAGAGGLSGLRYGVEFSLLPGQTGEVDLVAELAAEQLLRQHVGIIQHRMNDRDLLLVIELGKAVVVDRPDVEIATFARPVEIKLRNSLRGKAGLERVECTVKLPQLIII